MIIDTEIYNLPNYPTLTTLNKITTQESTHSDDQVEHNGSKQPDPLSKQLILTSMEYDTWQNWWYTAV